MDDFDVRLQTPHAPGYWLYLAGGHALRTLGAADATGSLLLLSALVSSATTDP